MKGQSSIEYLLLFLISLLIFIPVVFQSADLFTQRRSDVSYAQAQNTVDFIASAVDQLCIQSNSSKITMLVDIPSEIVGNSSGFSGRTISIVLQSGKIERTVYANVKCDVDGSFPSSGGRHSMIIMKNDPNVTISKEG